jgi:c-di-GMP-binding flagellar brake protein YcgR
VFFWKAWTRRRAGHKPLVRATITERQRETYRASVEFSLVYVLAGRAGARTALANDLSAGGLRLIGDEDFADEATIELRFTLPNDLISSVTVEKEIVQTTSRGRTTRKIKVPPEPFTEMTVHAKVVMAFWSLRRRKFSHGLRFIGTDEQTQEEIQRFIHVWQIRQLRERAHLRGE